MPLNEKKLYYIYLLIILGFLYSCFVGFKYLEKYDVVDNKKLVGLLHLHPVVNALLNR